MKNYCNSKERVTIVVVSLRVDFVLNGDLMNCIFHLESMFMFILFSNEILFNFLPIQVNTR